MFNINSSKSSFKESKYPESIRDPIKEKEQNSLVKQTREAWEARSLGVNLDNPSYHKRGRIEVGSNCRSSSVENYLSKNPLRVASADIESRNSNRSQVNSRNSFFYHRNDSRDRNFRSTAPTSSIIINKKIILANNPFEIRQVWDQDKRDFNHVNITTAFSCLIKMGYSHDEDRKLVPIFHKQSGNSSTILPQIFPNNSESTACIDNASSSLQKDRKTNSIEFSSVYEKRDLVHDLGLLALNIIDEFEPRNLSNLASSYVKLDILPPQNLFKAIGEKSKNKIDRFNPQDLSILAWSYAKLDILPPEGLFEAIEQTSKAKIYQFTPQNLTNLAWAYAKLDILPRRGLFEAIGEKSKKTIDDFNPQNLVNLLWSYAKLDIFPSSTLLEKIAKACDREIFNFKPQDLTSFAWAYAKLNILPPQQLFEAIGERSKRRISDFKPQELTKLASSYAKLNMPAPTGLFEAIAEESKNKMVGFNPQDLSILSWSYAKLDITPPRGLFEAIGEKSKTTINSFKPQELSNLAWSYAKVRISPPSGLFQAIGDESKGKIADFTPQNLTNLVLSYAKLDISPPEGLFEIVGEECKKKIADFTPQNLSNLAWSFAIIDPKNKKIFNSIRQQLIWISIDIFKKEELSQLLYAQAVLKPFIFLPKEWREVTIMQSQHGMSNLQRDVIGHLKMLEKKFEVEYFESSFSHYIDIAFIEEKIAIEVDGPLHFTINTNKKLGFTLLRNQLLAKSGWKVISIPWWEWAGLKNFLEKKEYLREILTRG